MTKQYTRIEFPEDYQFSDLVNGVFAPYIVEKGITFVVVEMPYETVSQCFSSHAGSSEDSADGTVRFARVPQALSLAA